MASAMGGGFLYLRVVLLMTIVSTGSNGLLRGACPRLGRQLRLRAAAVEEDDPFTILKLNSRLLRFSAKAARAKAIRRRVRDALFQSHPDTAERPDAEKFGRVLRASKALATDSGVEAALLTQLRNEVPDWSSADLAAYLKTCDGIPDSVPQAFVDEGVSGVDIVGDARYGGDDVEHFIHAFRCLGTTSEEEASRVEAVIRDLSGCALGWTFARQPRSSRTNRYHARS